MRDDRELHTLRIGHPAAAASALIIPFPSRGARRTAGAPASAVTAQAIAALLETIAHALEPGRAAHPATHLAALGAFAGFAAQQSVLMAGAHAWVQPARNGHLDRLLLSDAPVDASLWLALRVAAHTLNSFSD